MSTNTNKSDRLLRLPVASDTLLRGESIAEPSAMNITAGCDVSAADWPEPLPLKTILPSVPQLNSALPQIAVALLLNLTDRASVAASLSTSVLMLVFGWVVTLIRKYVATHARRLFSGADRVAMYAQWIVAQIENGSLGASFTMRDLQRRTCAGSENALMANVALKRLAAAHWVRLRRVYSDGRPSEIWDVSPRILASKGVA